MQKQRKCPQQHYQRGARAMRLKFKKGDIPSARMICVDLLGPPDGEDFDGNGYGSVDIAEILSGAYEAQRERIALLESVAEALVEIMPNLEMSYAIKTKQYLNLETVLGAAGYLGEGK